MNEDSFPTETSKIFYILSSMKPGTTAMAWGFPYLKQLNDRDPNCEIDSLNTLNLRFMETFTDSTSKFQAERAMKRLKQTGSAADYASKFRVLLVETGDLGEGGKTMFIDGLKSNVKYELRKTIAMYEGMTALEQGAERPDAIAQMDIYKIMSLAVSIDSTLYAAEGERDWKPKRWEDAPTVQGKAATMSVPKEEKDRRMKEGICIKCGKGKHRFALCKTGWYYENKDNVQGKVANVDSSDSEKD
jgi:hypothetical protein